MGRCLSGTAGERTKSVQVFGKGWRDLCFVECRIAAGDLNRVIRSDLSSERRLVKDTHSNPDVLKRYRTNIAT